MTWEDGCITYNDFTFQLIQPVHKFVADMYLNIVPTR